jgi:hypothetical protein
MREIYWNAMSPLCQDVGEQSSLTSPCISFQQIELARSIMKKPFSETMSMLPARPFHFTGYLYNSKRRILCHGLQPSRQIRF